MITNETYMEWYRQPPTITKDEYRLLQTCVRESMERLVESHIQGSEEFNQALYAEVERRRDLAAKMAFFYERGEK